MAEENEPPKNESSKDESLKEKLSGKIENIKSHQTVDQICKYAKTNTADTIAYVLMILGVVLVFPLPMYGGILVGIVAGLYFADDVVRWATSLNSIIEEQGMVRSVMLLGVVIAFFVSIPWIFIGGALAVGIKQILFSGTSSGKGKK